VNRRTAVPAVVLDLVHPVGPAGGLAARLGMQGSMKPLGGRGALASISGLIDTASDPAINNENDPCPQR